MPWQSTRYERQSPGNGAHHKVLLVGEHDIGCVGIISTIGFIDLEFFLLLFRMGHEGWRYKEGAIMGTRNGADNGDAKISPSYKKYNATHVLREMETPALVLPWQFGGTF
jgi:hypothetical protein